MGAGVADVVAADLGDVAVDDEDPPVLGERRGLGVEHGGVGEQPAPGVRVGGGAAHPSARRAHTVVIIQHWVQ